MDTDLAAVPAETVSEVGCGGALLVHQQQTGKQSLQLQGDHSDLQKEGKTFLHVTKTDATSMATTYSTGTYFGPWLLFVFQAS